MLRQRLCRVIVASRCLFTSFRLIHILNRRNTTRDAYLAVFEDTICILNSDTFVVQTKITFRQLKHFGPVEGTPRRTANLTPRGFPSTPAQLKPPLSHYR